MERAAVADCMEVMARKTKAGHRDGLWVEQKRITDWLSLPDWK